MSAHPLDGAFQRVDRAQEHFAELQRHIADFRKVYLETSRIHFDPHPPYDARVFTPQTIFHPPIISIVLGEIVYNLRSALDYLIFELARHDSGHIEHGTQFPIDDRPKQFAGNKASRLAGLSLEHIAAIERFQPYKGCNWTKVIRTLSNPDKHRHLTHRGSMFTVLVMTEGMALPAGTNARAVRKATRPDGVEVNMELVGSIDILVEIITEPMLGAIGDSAEKVAEHLIPKVRDLLETFKPEFK